VGRIRQAKRIRSLKLSEDFDIREEELCPTSGQRSPFRWNKRTGRCQWL